MYCQTLCTLKTTKTTAKNDLKQHHTCFLQLQQLKPDDSDKLKKILKKTVKQVKRRCKSMSFVKVCGLTNVGVQVDTLHYEEYLNSARYLSNCHGVSLEGGLVPETVASVSAYFSLSYCEVKPFWGGLLERLVTMGTVHAKVNRCSSVSESGLTYSDLTSLLCCGQRAECCTAAPHL